jgi:hypothetical protein
MISQNSLVLVVYKNCKMDKMDTHLLRYLIQYFRRFLFKHCRVSYKKSSRIFVPTFFILPKKTTGEKCSRLKFDPNILFLKRKSFSEKISGSNFIQKLYGTHSRWWSPPSFAFFSVLSAESKKWIKKWILVYNCCIFLTLNFILK